MGPDVQAAVNVLEVVTSLIGAILVPVILMDVAQRTAAQDSRVRSVPFLLGLGIAAWYAVVDTIGRSGGFSALGRASAHFPMIGLGVFIPIAVALFVLPLIAPLQRLVSDDRVQPAWIAVQSYRVIPGAMFLLLLFLHRLPAIFAVPAGVGDMFVGLTAFPASIWLRDGRHGLAVAWNLIGLLDLVFAIGLGVTTSPGVLHLIHASPSTVAATMAPVVIVPTFIVPLCVWLHSISLRHLFARRAALGIPG